MTTEQLATKLHAGTIEQLRKAKRTIEVEQEAPLDLDQATVIHDLCVALDVMPLSVLDEALNLIEPGAPLLEALEGEPGLLEELGEALQ